MTKRHDPIDTSSDGAYRIWSITEFGDRYRLDDREQQRLLQIFGPFATTRELLSNARREARLH